VLNSPDLVKKARPFAILSMVLWFLAIASGRLTAYPGFVGRIFGLE
jgi:hypothetical protein